MNDYLNCLKKYAVFSGRARRREFWMFLLFNVLIAMGVGFVFGLIAVMTKTPEIVLLAHVYTLATLIPCWAVSVRRLHDIGYSGWCLLLSLIPFVGLILLVFYCRDSQPGENAYGTNPKG